MDCRARNIIFPSGATERCCVISVSARTTIRFSIRGLQDITAWVDFTALAEAVRGGRVRARGLHDASYFLAGLGIDREMQLTRRQR